MGGCLDGVTGGRLTKPDPPNGHRFGQPDRMPTSLLSPPWEFPPGPIMTRHSAGGNPEALFLLRTHISKDFWVSLRGVGVSASGQLLVLFGRPKGAHLAGLGPAVHTASHVRCGKGRNGDRNRDMKGAGSRGLSTRRKRRRGTLEQNSRAWPREDRRSTR